MMSAIAVSTTINGDEIEYLCHPEETLLDVLRDRLELMGAKEGCGTGDCGACSVILDGRLVCACLVLGAEAEGREMETIEGMANGDSLHPLQTKFLEHAALQCGVCTPGFLIAAKDLLEKNPNPTEEEIRFGLAGNLCRCTGYDKIVRAVQDAAREMRGACKWALMQITRRESSSQLVPGPFVPMVWTRSPGGRDTAQTSTCRGNWWDKSCVARMRMPKSGK